MLWTLQQSSSNLLNYWCHISCILPAPSSCPLACGFLYLLVFDSLPGFWEFLPLTHWLFSSCLSQLAHSILVLPPGTHTSAQTLPSKHVDSFQGWVIETKEQSLQLAPAKVSVSLFFFFLKKICFKVCKHLLWNIFPLSVQKYTNTSTDIWAHVFLHQGVMRLRAAYAPGDGELSTVWVGALPSCETGAWKPMWIEGPVKWSCGYSDPQL